MIHYFVDSGVPGASRRDFLEKRVVARDFPSKGSVTLVTYSIEHPKCPEVKGVVRADTYISGFICRPINKN